MAIEPVKATLIWEDNPDTILYSYNLSKMIDIQSESKFIHFTEAQTDYEKWADLIIQDAVSADPFAAYATSIYQGQVIYNISTHIAKRIVKNTDLSYSAVVYNSPYKKLLKILANTKIAMSFQKDNKTLYHSFEIGIEDKLFSSDHLLTESDFQATTTYDIYLYYHLSYGDYAQIKIMNSAETAWKTTAVDASSPSGYKLISSRKIGGFTTDENGYIIEDSVWDISTLLNEIAVKTLKKYDAVKEEFRVFSANDIPIKDSQGIINATDVEEALEEIKLKVDKIYSDIYTTNRYGMNLTFCNLKKEGGSLVDCVVHDLTLKISAGYIDVYGERIYFNEDVYLASSTTPIRINTGSAYVTPAYLGSSTTLNAIYDSSTDGSGTIWRVYIDINGKIILKENSVVRPQYFCQGKLRGWYDPNNVARCIGKFKVRKTSFYYIEKHSVLDTIDREMIPNEVVIIHGTMCPDGTVPCDGYWHDTIGTDMNTYNTRPATTTWVSSWYEETPNLLNKTIKMPSTSVISVGPFTMNNGVVTSGGSESTGASGGSSTHTHTHAHSHGVGTIKIVESGSHIHEDITFTQYVNESVYVTPTVTGTKVTTDVHDHNIIVGGGAHSHNSADFSGSVALLTGNDAVTEATSSWAPYKEMMFCIKK